MSDIVKVVLVLTYKVETEYIFDFKNNSYSFIAGSLSINMKFIKSSVWFLAEKDSIFFTIKNYKIR